MSAQSFPNAGRLLGLDLGDARIGVATCDGVRVLASPVGVIKRVGDRTKEFAELADFIAEFEAMGIVVGDPVNLDGSSSVQTDKVRKEAAAIEKRLGVPVILWDERLSSSEGHQRLRESNVAAKRQRQMIDAVAASIILQSFIDSNR